ncbi:MAG: hypothetical protein AAF213_05240 [Pseudomonadota bacterium]
MMPSIRLLPVMIVVAFMVLSVRVVDVVTGESMARDPFDFDAVVTLSQARADDGEGEELAAPADEMDEVAQVAAVDADAGMTDENGAEAAEEDIWFDPENRELTRSELRLLQELSERRQDLMDRERQLDQREALLDAAEARFEEKFTELAALRDQLQGLLKAHDEDQEAKLASLVRIYESMKPKDAARIFDNLDMDVLLDVVVRMKESRSAAVLAEMQPDRAKEVTLQLVDQRSLPQPVVLE